MSLSVLFLLILSVTSSWAQTTTPKPPHTHRPKPTHPPGPDVVTALTSMGGFTTLLDLVNKAGLGNTLMSAPELTLFAPTDDAFARLPAGTLQALENDPNLLKATLTYHATADTLEIRGKIQDKTLQSLDNGLPIRLNIYGNLHVVAAEGINITMKNIDIKNGFVHVLDGVMTPPQGNIVDIIDNKANMKQLSSVLQSSGLKDVVKTWPLDAQTIILQNSSDDMNITVFVPNDDAFAKVEDKIMNYLLANPTDLKEVILYHVISSITLYSIGMKHTLTFPSSDHRHDRIMTLEDSTNNIYINDAKVLERDISALNGVIHIIDKVLIPARILLHIEDQGLTVG